MFGVEDVDLVEALFEHARKPRALGVGLLSLGDVVRDFRRADDAPARVLDRRDGERHVDECAVLPPPHGFVRGDHLAAFHPPEDLGFLVFALGRNEDRDRLPDHLRRGVAEHPLRAFVPGGDDALERLADDRVVGKFDHRCEPRVRFLEFAALGGISGNDE